MLFNLKGKIRLYNPPQIDNTLTKEDYCADAKATGDALAKKVAFTDIADNLTTQNSDKVLSARIGVVIQNQIDSLNKSIDGLARLGQAIFYTTEDKDIEAGSAMFYPEYIETNGATLAVGNMILTPSGRLYRISTLPYGEVEVIHAFYLTNLGSDSEGFSHGVSIYRTTTTLSDEMADSIYPFDFTELELNDGTPVVGDWIVDPAGRLFQISDVYGTTADATWIDTMNKDGGPKGEEGGYYIPNVELLESNHLKFSYTASKEGMPEFSDRYFELPSSVEASTEAWVFTLEDGSTVTKNVVVSA